MVGKTILHYECVEKLGAGGMGEIYKAHDSRLNRFVVIKVLPSGMSADPDRRRRFLQEARAASALNHPNIVTIYDVVDEGAAHYIVMEYVVGKTMLELIPKEGLRISVLLKYATQIAGALAAAHAAGIIHRDLKPANVMVTESGLVKLLDFGLAKLGDPVAAAPTAETATVWQGPATVAGVILGTVNYMSPEQAEGRPVDARSDIFSFGALLYEMATGRSAFQGGSVLSVLSAVLRDPVRPVSEVVASVPPQVDSIVARCLEKDPDRRWQSMREVETALLALQAQPDSGSLYRSAAQPAPPLTVAVAAPPAKGREAVVAVAVAALLIAAGAGGWWWMTHNKVPRQPAVQPAAPVVATPEGPRPSAFDAAPKSEPPAAPVPAKPITVAVPDGQPFRMTLAADVPAGVPEDYALQFKVADPVRVGDTVVIPRGAVVTGFVEQVGKKILGLGGKVQFRLQDVQAVDGKKLPARATPARRADGAPRSTLNTGGREKPKNLTAAAGADYTGYVDGAQTISLRPAN